MIPVKVDVSFSTPVDEYLKGLEQMRPSRLICQTAHAQSLEEGTGPLKDYQPTVDGGAYTKDSIRSELDEWARRKLGMENVKHRREFVDSITERFWNEGMREHRFWQPVMIWLEDNIQYMFDAGMSFKDMTDEAYRRVYKNIVTQDLIFNGELLNSLISQYIPDDRELNKDNIEMDRKRPKLDVSKAIDTLW